MTKKNLIFLLPLFLMAEIILFTSISEMLRQSSDVAVLAGVILICIALTGNFYLVKLFFNIYKVGKK